MEACIAKHTTERDIIGVLPCRACDLIPPLASGGLKGGKFGRSQKPGSRNPMIDQKSPTLFFDGRAGHGDMTPKAASSRAGAWLTLVRKPQSQGKI